MDQSSVCVDMRTCPECGRKVRPCNLQRHRRTHLPVPTARDYGTKWMPARRPPIRKGGTHDRMYDEHIPRGEGPHRFRIYRLRAGSLDIVASCPTPEDMGYALFHLGGEGEFSGGDDVVGVLDTIEDPGHWVIHPYTLGRSPVKEAA